MNIQELKSLKVKIDRVEKELAACADRHPMIGLLMTIAGVGIRTAETFVAWIDYITRFRRTYQLGAYFGQVPCQDENRLGNITRDGRTDLAMFSTEPQRPLFRK